MIKTQIYFFCLLLIFFVGCTGNTKDNITQLNSVYAIKVYETKGIGYGYDIYKDSNVYIHQPSIPGIQGNQGFATEEDANRVAELMIKKLTNNVMPPSITSEELDSLNVLPKN